MLDQLFFDVSPASAGFQIKYSAPRPSVFFFTLKVRALAKTGGC